MKRDWPFLDRNQKSDWPHNSLDWSVTNSYKQHNKKKYRLYWSPSKGGLWVEYQ